MSCPLCASRNSTFIKPGVYNGVLVPAEAIQNSVPSIFGRFLLPSHLDPGTEPTWPDVAYGQVINYRLDPDTSALTALLNLFPDRVPPSIMASWKAGEPVGVSSQHTAYFQEQRGSFEGKPYSAITAKMYFEAIAITPYPACTPQQGCSSSLLTQSAKATKATGDSATLTLPDTLAHIKAELGIGW